MKDREQKDQGRNYAKGENGKKRVLYFIDILLFADEDRQKEQTQDSSQSEVTLTWKDDKTLCVSGVGEKGTSTKKLEDLVEMYQDDVLKDRIDFYDEKSLYKPCKKKVDLQDVFDFLNNDKEAEQFYTKHDPTPHNSIYCRKFDLILKDQKSSREENLRYVANKLKLHLPRSSSPNAGKSEDLIEDTHFLYRKSLSNSELTDSDKQYLVEQIRIYYANKENSLKEIFSMNQQIFGTNFYGWMQGENFNIRISSLVQELILRNKLDDFIRIVRDNYPNFASFA